MSPSDLLKITSHRPFELPQKPWKYYQEWVDTIFMHWKVDPADIAPLLPNGLTLDVINNEAWVSVVGFTVKNMRPRFMPPLPYVSDFHEINLRTYATKDGIPGIYFISIEASKAQSVFLAKYFVVLKYKKAKIKRSMGRYTLHKSREDNYFNAKYVPLHDISTKAAIDRWLTERYCAYEEINNVLYRFNIHHVEWPLKQIKIKEQKVYYKKSALIINNRPPHLQHFSRMQKVLLWGREKC